MDIGVEAPHVLVVDDDAPLRSLLQRYLLGQGFRVSTAGSAGDARRLLEAMQPDLMVLDVTMPGENGLQLTRALRENGHDMPILLLTARGEPQDRIAGLEAGSDDYLGKPFEPRELLLRLRALLGGGGGALFIPPRPGAGCPGGTARCTSPAASRRC